MRAAIYARKSTDQSAIVDEQKSVARQVAHAKAFAERKGWQVVEACIFVDDGVSGAEFERRPGFLRLMNALAPRPQFDVLILSEESRLGREAIETAYALKRIITAGVRVFFYLEDRERVLQSPTDKLLMSVAAFADELERERARQRTKDALQRKAEAGHVTGGRVFGYDNVEVRGAAGERSHVTRVVNQLEANVVRRIFEMSAAGFGLKRIAKQLNEDGAVAPRSQRGRPVAWCPSSIRSILLRDTYRGVLIWNRTAKRNQWGQRSQQRRASGEWLQRPAEDLRIVTDEAWQAAQALMAQRRTLHAQLGGRSGGQGRLAGSHSKYLLSGLASCGYCGGTLTVRTQNHGTRRVPRLACWNYMTRGRTVCDNKWEAPLAAVEDLVLSAIEAEVLSAEVMQVAINHALASLTAQQSSASTDRDRAGDELASLEREAERLTSLVAQGLGDLPEVVTRLRSIRDRRAELERAVGRRDRVLMHPQVARRALADTLRQRLLDWRGLLRRNPTEARSVLQLLLQRRIQITPDRARPTRAPVFDIEFEVFPDMLLRQQIGQNEPVLWRPRAFQVGTRSPNFSRQCSNCAIQRGSRRER